MIFVRFVEKSSRINEYNRPSVLFDTKNTITYLKKDSIYHF